MARAPSAKLVKSVEIQEIQEPKVDPLRAIEEQIAEIRIRLSEMEKKIEENSLMKKDLVSIIIKLERMGLLDHSIANSFGVMRV